MAPSQFSLIARRFIAIVVMVIGIFLSTVAVQFWMAPHILVAAESLYWIDIQIWLVLGTILVTLFLLSWLMASFSFLALVSVVCVAIAVVILINGFSTIMALLLVAIALRGASLLES